MPVYTYMESCGACIYVYGVMWCLYIRIWSHVVHVYTYMESCGACIYVYGVMWCMYIRIWSHVVHVYTYMESCDACIYMWCMSLVFGGDRINLMEPELL